MGFDSAAAAAALTARSKNDAVYVTFLFGVQDILHSLGKTDRWGQGEGGRTLRKWFPAHFATSRPLQNMSLLFCCF
jgi:hypothetical protein